MSVISEETVINQQTLGIRVINLRNLPKTQLTCFNNQSTKRLGIKLEEPETLSFSEKNFTMSANPSTTGQTFSNLKDVLAKSESSTPKKNQEVV